MDFKNLKIAREVIKHRDVRFKFESTEVDAHWVKKDPWLSHFFNGLFFIVPDGERWVIESARSKLPNITDPDLVEIVKAFIKQEATHSREHNFVNRLMIANGLPAEKIEEHFSSGRKFLQKYLPNNLQASIAAGIEHINAVLSEVVLEFPEIFEDMEPKMRALVLWHLVEEAEHKAVFMDILNHENKGSVQNYLLRAVGLILPVMTELPLVVANMMYLLVRDGQIKNKKSIINFMNYMFFDEKVLLRMAHATFAYLKPNFHPWDRDNRALLKSWTDKYDETGDVIQAGDALIAWQKQQLHQKIAHS